jgi:hypothetical protein
MVGEVLAENWANNFFAQMDKLQATRRLGDPNLVENVDGVQVPIDPMDLVQCDSCQ